jgi:hypothetical protein
MPGSSEDARPEYRVGDISSERLSVRRATANAGEDAASLVWMTQALALSWRTRSGINGCDGREAPGRVIPPLMAAKRTIAALLFGRGASELRRDGRSPDIEPQRRDHGGHHRESCERVEPGGEAAGAVLDPTNNRWT